MLVDEGIWKRVDHAIVAVSGTRDLGLSDVQELVNLFKDRLPVNIPIATSASLDEESHENVRMTVLLATTAPARLSVPELAANFEKPAKKKRVKAETVPLPKIAAKAPVEPPVEPPAKKPHKPMPVAPPTPVEPLVPAPEELEAMAEEELPPLPSEPELEAPIAPVASTSVRARRFEAKQEEMQFESAPRGRFEKTHETMYRGENLDQPTFRRRGLKIRV
jgi:hypothetical protein